MAGRENSTRTRNRLFAPVLRRVT